MRLLHTKLPEFIAKMKLAAAEGNAPKDIAIRGMENPYHYRNKVISTFTTGWGGKLTSGIYAANSHKVLPVERCLLQDALACDVPVLGHCFGAQMLARAMGARVWRNPCPHIGWSSVWVTRQAQDLMQLPRQITQFNWHYDTFGLPPGATRSMYGALCLNKGFVHGRHWAFQGHLEVTEASVRAWCLEGEDELRHASGPAVQRAAQILAQLPQQLARLHATARRTYSAWTAQLDRPALFQLGALPGAPSGLLPARHSAPDTPPCALSNTLSNTELSLQYQALLAIQTRAILARAVQ